jgi:hypothetical protein
VSTAAAPYSTCEVAGTLEVQVIVALERVTLLASTRVMTGATSVGVMLGVGLEVGLIVWVTVGVLVVVSVGVTVGVVVRVGVRVMV